MTGSYHDVSGSRGELFTEQLTRRILGGQRVNAALYTTFMCAAVPHAAFTTRSSRHSARPTGHSPLAHGGSVRKGSVTKGRLHGGGSGGRRRRRRCGGGAKSPPSFHVL